MPTKQDHSKSTEMTQTEAAVREVCSNDATYQAFLDSDSRTVQRLLAGSLRATAMNHLTEGTGVIAEGFRGNFTVSDLSAQANAFIATQKENYVWATDVEAQALGERFNCHVVVTKKIDNQPDNTRCAHRASDNAPVIHLIHEKGNHWSFEGEQDPNKKTRGNGNCLYNAFAQALQKLAKEDYASQPSKNIEKVISKEKTPEEARAALIKDHEREKYMYKNSEGFAQKLDSHIQDSHFIFESQSERNALSKTKKKEKKEEKEKAAKEPTPQAVSNPQSQTEKDEKLARELQEKEDAKFAKKLQAQYDSRAKSKKSSKTKKDEPSQNTAPKQNASTQTTPETVADKRTQMSEQFNRVKEKAQLVRADAGLLPKLSRPGQDARTELAKGREARAAKQETSQEREVSPPRARR